MAEDVLKFGICNAGNERTRRKHPLISTSPTSLACNQIIRSNAMNTLLFERPVWFATDPLSVEEEAHEMEEFIYHRPVLESEVMELLAPTTRVRSLSMAPVVAAATPKRF